MGLWDYPDVVHELMDLGTVLSKLSSSKYDCADDVADDVRTVFNNCMTYNTEGSDFYSLGESYLLRFESMFEKLAMYGTSDRGSRVKSERGGAAGGEKLRGVKRRAGNTTIALEMRLHDKR